MTNDELIELVRERMAKYINNDKKDEEIVHFGGDRKLRYVF